MSILKQSGVNLISILAKLDEILKQKNLRYLKITGPLNINLQFIVVEGVTL